MWRFSSQDECQLRPTLQQSVALDLSLPVTVAYIQTLAIEFCQDRSVTVQIWRSMENSTFFNLEWSTDVEAPGNAPVDSMVSVGLHSNVESFLYHPRCSQIYIQLYRMQWRCRVITEI